MLNRQRATTDYACGEKSSRLVSGIRGIGGLLTGMWTPSSKNKKKLEASVCIILYLSKADLYRGFTALKSVKLTLYIKTV